LGKVIKLFSIEQIIVSNDLGVLRKISEKLGEARRGGGVNALWQSLRTLPKCVM